MYRFLIAWSRFTESMASFDIVYKGCLFYSLRTLNYHRIKSLNGLFLSLSGILLQRLCIHDYLIWQLEFDCKYDYESSGNHPTFAQFQENI